MSFHASVTPNTGKLYQPYSLSGLTGSDTPSKVSIEIFRTFSLFNQAAFFDLSFLYV